MQISFGVIDLSAFLRRSGAGSEVFDRLADTWEFSLNLYPSRKVTIRNREGVIVVSATHCINHRGTSIMNKLADLTIFLKARSCIATHIISNYVRGTTYVLEGDVQVIDDCQEGLNAGAGGEFSPDQL